ncbi:MAG: glutamyl-tRNA reductase, partial [Gammaproteobacteria bacterium]|nr:glutamyl-tRNA reductase [Gammaproteobacteria bacterium]
FMVDIAVPRDVEPEVGELDDVYLYTVDDLQEIIQDNLESRKQAAEQAIEIIHAQVDNFLNWQRTLEAVDVIREMRDCAESLSNEVMDKAMKQLAQGKSTEQAMQFLAHTLMNKFLHQPSIQLRQAGQDSRHDLIEFARQLFLGKDADKTEDKK